MGMKKISGKKKLWRVDTGVEIQLFLCLSLLVIPTLIWFGKQLHWWQKSTSEMLRYFADSSNVSLMAKEIIKGTNCMCWGTSGQKDMMHL